MDDSRMAGKDWSLPLPETTPLLQSGAQASASGQASAAQLAAASGAEEVGEAPLRSWWVRQRQDHQEQMLRWLSPSWSRLIKMIVSAEMLWKLWPQMTNKFELA